MPERRQNYNLTQDDPGSYGITGLELLNVVHRKHGFLYAVISSIYVRNHVSILHLNSVLHIWKLSYSPCNEDGRSTWNDAFMGIFKTYSPIKKFIWTALSCIVLL